MGKQSARAGAGTSARRARLRAKLRGAWRATRAGARRAADLVPLTPLGALVLPAAALGMWFYGVRRIDLVFLVVGGVTLAVGALAILSVVIAAIGLRLWLRRTRAEEGATSELECGYPTRTGFTLPTLWYVPFVRVTWSWLEPEAKVVAEKSRRRWTELVTPSRRGVVEEVRRRVEVSDAFGLAKVALRLREERNLRLMPSVGALRNMSVVRSISSGEDMPFPGGQPEGERADLRRYVPGDPVRFVLWKVFAKTRTLVVRTPEQAISPARQTLAYLVAGADDEAAAGTARVAVETGALGSSWVLGADGVAEVARGKSHALEIIARSAHCPPEQHGAGLSAFLKRHAQAGARVVVFVPATPGPWLERVTAAARARATGNARMSDLELVVCTDGIDRAGRASWLRRLTTAEPRRQPGAEPPPTPLASVQAVTGALGGARAPVLLVDRKAGRVYGEAHQRALSAPLEAGDAAERPLAPPPPAGGAARGAAAGAG
jgi:hypothetical protein